MAFHAIYALTGLCKNELIDSVLAYFTLEAMGVIRVVASHDGFIENGEVTDIAVVRTVGTDRGSVGQQ